jgi:hypothetical protein
MSWPIPFSEIRTPKPVSTFTRTICASPTHPWTFSLQMVGICPPVSRRFVDHTLSNRRPFIETGALCPFRRRLFLRRICAMQMKHMRTFCADLGVPSGAHLATARHSSARRTHPLRPANLSVWDLKTAWRSCTWHSVALSLPCAQSVCPERTVETHLFSGSLYRMKPILQCNHTNSSSSSRAHSGRLTTLTEQTVRSNHHFHTLINVHTRT